MRISGLSASKISPARTDVSAFCVCTRRIAHAVLVRWRGFVPVPRARCLVSGWRDVDQHSGAQIRDRQSPTNGDVDLHGAVRPHRIDPLLAGAAGHVFGPFAHGHYLRENDFLTPIRRAWLRAACQIARISGMNSRLLPLTLFFASLGGPLCNANAQELEGLGGNALHKALSDNAARWPIRKTLVSACSSTSSSACASCRCMASISTSSNSTSCRRGRSST